MTVSDNTIQAEGFVDFFQNLGEKGLNISKKMAKNVLKNPGRALDVSAKVARRLLLETLKQLYQP